MKQKSPPHLNITKSLKTFKKAQSLIPGGTLGIRRPYNFVPGEYPIFLDHGQGGRITDIDGNEYVDYLCAYGPIILGYREREVDEAVIRQIRDKGFCFTLTQTFQNTLAEKIKKLIPSAEMSIFVKTGSDATTTAIRLSRAYTGRISIMRCGYHGWHDWCVEVKAGIPKKLYEDVYDFHYNNLEALSTLLKKHGKTTAAIIITPFGHPLGAPLQEPAPGFLEGVRTLARKYGCVLIFDEIRTGFRLALGGAQSYYGVTPDLTCIGKAMANGYAISAVCGRSPVMKMAEKDVFISSTFFPNSTGYVAALKTLEILERKKVLDVIWKKSGEFMVRLEKIIQNSKTGAELSGVGPMFFITFKKDDQNLYRQKRLDFYTQLIRRGIFMQPYHHGYVCYRHTQADLRRTEQAVKKALDYIEGI